MIITPKEALRNLATRLEVYRQAVQNGFYNEWPETVGYRGYQIVQEGEKFAVVQHGVLLIQVKSMQIAKVWVVCRTNNCTMVEANRLVTAEEMAKSGLTFE